jgi:tetratricopeptide (TPR) repeat protein
VKNANLEAAVNLEVRDGAAHFGFYTTRQHAGARAQLSVAGKRVFDEPVDIGPASPFTKQVVLPAGAVATDVRASRVADGRELVSYTPITLTPEPMPAAVTPPVAPKDIANDEELDLTGQRIDQFHDPLHEAEPYWQEALRRDPGDTTAHFNIGLGDLRAARYTDAEVHFRRALDRLTARYTSPKDVEPLYYLGLALRGEGRDDEAFDAFYKAAWSQEWRAPAYFSLAEISSSKGDFPKALNFVDQSLQANALNLRAYGLKAALLRHLGRDAEARALLGGATDLTDPLDVRLMAEAWLADPTPRSEALLFGMLDGHVATAQELAADYGNAGLWKDGLTVLSAAVDRKGGCSRSPIVLYYAGDFAQRTGDEAGASEFRREAAALAPDYVFPFQAELIPVLRRAIAANPGDARAPYYLGNLLFDWQPAEATRLWEKSSQMDPSFAIVWRNLAQAYAHSGETDGRARAIGALEKAVSLSDRYPAHFSELDSLYARAGEPVRKRLEVLESHQAAIVNDDESLARLIALETFAGKSDEAIALLQAHTFNIWEGGTQFDTGGMWIDAHLAHGRGMLAAGKPDAALADFQAALEFPENLRALPWEGVGSRAIEVGYWTGSAYQALGQAAKANEAWQAAASATVPHTLRRNDANASFDRNVQQYYQAMAMQGLGRTDDAHRIFVSLVEAGAAKDEDPGAAAGPRFGLSPRNRAADAHFLSGLGHDGLGEKAKARSEFESALASSPDDLGAELAMGDANP